MNEQGKDLDRLVARLITDERVDAVALIGSVADGSFNPASDYDVLIVMNQSPVHIVGGVTYADGRMVDIAFMTRDEIDGIIDAGQAEISAEGVQGAVLRWMATARIEFDRRGRLGRLQEKVRSRLPIRSPSEGEKLSRWDKASYNAAHTQRMLASDDPVYALAIDLRLLYQLSDLMVDYFRVRDLPWPGEKAAIRHWRAHDPAYVELFAMCLGEEDRHRKVGLYRDLAQATVAPVRTLWSTGTTALRLSPDTEMTDENLCTALHFWETLGSEAEAR